MSKGFASSKPSTCLLDPIRTRLFNEVFPFYYCPHHLSLVTRTKPTDQNQQNRTSSESGNPLASSGIRRRSDLTSSILRTLWVERRHQEKSDLPHIEETSGMKDERRTRLVSRHVFSYVTMETPQQNSWSHLWRRNGLFRYGSSTQQLELVSSSTFWDLLPHRFLVFISSSSSSLPGVFLLIGHMMPPPHQSGRSSSDLSTWKRHKGVWLMEFGGNKQQLDTSCFITDFLLCIVTVATETAL